MAPATLQVSENAVLEVIERFVWDAAVGEQAREAQRGNSALGADDFSGPSSAVVFATTVVRPQRGGDEDELPGRRCGGEWHR